MTSAEPIRLHPEPTEEVCLNSQIPILVGHVFAAASPGLRNRMLQRLLLPLNALSQVAVADGAFARLGLRSRGRSVEVDADDLAGVRATHVSALVDHAQQVDVEAVDGLADLWPTTAQGDAATDAEPLIAMLQRRASLRADRAGADRQGGVSAAA